MRHIYYQLKSAPDFTLQKYSTLSEVGPVGVITQHQAFWRQLNQWGKLFKNGIHLIYQYCPEKPDGQKLSMILVFDVKNEEEAKCVYRLMQASVLAPYYENLEISSETCLSPYRYSGIVNLLKKERFIVPTTPSVTDNFYITSEWKMNEEARLYSLFRMMEAFDCPCAYCVDIYPCDYSEKLEKSLGNILPFLRELNAFRVKTDNKSVSSGSKDENAKLALDFYEDLVEKLTEAPHFLANIQVLCDNAAVAMQVIDAAASEALAEGNSTLRGQRAQISVFDAIEDGIIDCSSERVPKVLSYLPNLFTLEQLVPFVVFPVLYAGENIAMAKETVPQPLDGMTIGTDEHGYTVNFPWKQLVKHAFLAGMPGSGKTNTMMYLISEMHKAGIPVLILEPAKKEYRVLTTLEGMEDISLFSPSANSMFPIHINPFEFPEGMKLSDHINRLFDVFNGTFSLDPPMPMLLIEGITKCYEKHNWLPGMINSGKLEYPTMSELYKTIEELLDSYKYGEEVRDNLKSILQVRIGSLIVREMGDIFDVKKSTFAPSEWMKRSAVIEMASLGTGPSNFMMLMLMTLIRETLSVQSYNPDDYDEKPRHVIFVEEAHNLIANTSDQQPGVVDPKISATKYIIDMLKEVRALGEGIIIADQLPTAMAPEVVKNTSLKFALRLTSSDERETIGSTMSADAVQKERMGIFTPGVCLVGYEGLLKPFEMQIPEFKGDSTLDDVSILWESLTNPYYQENQKRSALVITEKFNNRLSQYENVWKELKKRMIVNFDEIGKTSQIQDKKSCDTEISRLVKSRTNLYKEYLQLRGNINRLYLDILLYFGCGYIRTTILDSMKDLDDEEYFACSKVQNDWNSLIKGMLAKVKETRLDIQKIVDALRFEGNIESAQLEDNFGIMQEIIIAGMRNHAWIKH